MSRLLKEELKRLLLIELSVQLEQAKMNHSNTVKAAFHDEAKSEHAKDTRATELSYLARGYAQRVEELTEGLRLAKNVAEENTRHQTIKLNSVVFLEHADAPNKAAEPYFFMPFGAGIQLEVAAHFFPRDISYAQSSNVDVKVITPKSPLGKAMMGKHEDDMLEVRVAEQSKAYVVTHIM